MTADASLLNPHKGQCASRTRAFWLTHSKEHLHVSKTPKATGWLDFVAKQSRERDWMTGLQSSLQVSVPEVAIWKCTFEIRPFLLCGVF